MTELAQSIQEAVTDRCAPDVGDHHRLVDKRREDVDDFERDDRRRTAHILGGGKREPTGTHRETLEEESFGVIEQLVRPAHGRQQGLMAVAASVSRCGFAAAPESGRRDERGCRRKSSTASWLPPTRLPTAGRQVDDRSTQWRHGRCRRTGRRQIGLVHRTTRTLALVERREDMHVLAADVERLLARRQDP